MAAQSTFRTVLVVLFAAIALLVLGLKFVLPLFANVFVGIAIPVRTFFVSAVVCTFGSLILFIWVVGRLRKSSR